MILKMKQIPSYAETASKTKVVGIHVLRTAVRTFILSGTWATSWQMQFAVAEGFTWFGLVCFKKKSTFYYDLLFFQEGSSCSFYRRFERFLFFLAGKRWKIKQDPLDFPGWKLAVSILRWTLNVVDAVAATKGAWPTGPPGFNIVGRWRRGGGEHLGSEQPDVTPKCS